jgi:lipoprotein NlpI
MQILLRHSINIIVLSAAVGSITCYQVAAIGDDQPSPQGFNHNLATQQWQARVAELDQLLAKGSGNRKVFSERGDCHFFLGDFPQALSDYDQVTGDNPREIAGNWRRGIALYFCDRFQESAAQFDAYHTIDQIDRENGIWRYLADTRSLGIPAARKNLLEYKKDDRPPFSDLYLLFAGTRSEQNLLDQFQLGRDAGNSPESFYLRLYLGFWCDSQDLSPQAMSHLTLATADGWPQRAGYGPNFMWHVGRLRLDQLRQKLESDRLRKPE